MAQQKWTMRGQYMESCNCDYLCPCIYTNPQAPVTYDHCTAGLVFCIDSGSYGDIALDGLKFALVIRSRKVMAARNWGFPRGFPWPPEGAAAHPAPATSRGRPGRPP